MLPSLVTDSVTPDLSRAVHYALLWGMEGVVLRSVGGAGQRVPFVNEAKVRARLADAELPVVAVDPGLFESAASRRAGWLNDLATFDETAAFCRRVGCDLVLVGALAGGEAWDAEVAATVLRQAGEAAARTGLRLGVQNAAGGACASGETLADLLARVGRPNVGAAWSPADAAEAGHDPAVGLAALRHADVPLVYVSVRDGVRSDGAWTPCTPGAGLVGWPEQIVALAGFDGPLGLAVDTPAPAKSGLPSASALIGMVRSVRRATR